MAKKDVIKTPSFQKIGEGVLLNFSGRRQIEAGKSTISFASISAAVSELSRKSDGGD